MKTYTLHIVTGAPGAGKSMAAAAFLRLKTEYLAFDIDWLAGTASDLAGKDIYTDPSTWPPYGALWFEVLHAVHKNGRTPVFFAPIDPDDIERYGQPAWCDGIAWLLLDCDDGTRRKRLMQRSDWTEAMVAEALEDARVLRGVVETKLDTGKLRPAEIALRIRDWL